VLTTSLINEAQQIVREKCWPNEGFQKSHDDLPKSIRDVDIIDQGSNESHKIKGAAIG
jgi:hypothetical protein